LIDTCTIPAWPVCAFRADHVSQHRPMCRKFGTALEPTCWQRQMRALKELRSLRDCYQLSRQYLKLPPVPQREALRDCLAKWKELKRLVRKCQNSNESRSLRWPIAAIPSPPNRLFAEFWGLAWRPDETVDVQLSFRVPKDVKFARDAAPEIISCYEHPNNWEPKPWEPGPFSETKEQPLIVPTRVWICFGPEATARGVWLRAENPPRWSAWVMAPAA